MAKRRPSPSANASPLHSSSARSSSSSADDSAASVPTAAWRVARSTDLWKRTASTWSGGMSRTYPAGRVKMRSRPCGRARRQRLPEVGDLRLQGTCGVGRLLVAPDQLREEVTAEGLTDADEHGREQQGRDAATDVDALGAVEDLERSEHPEFDGRRRYREVERRRTKTRRRLHHSRTPEP